MKTMIVTFKSGKTLKYHGNKLELLAMKVRIKKNEEKRKNLGMELDNAIKFEITECIY